MDSERKDIAGADTKNAGPAGKLNKTSLLRDRTADRAASCAVRALLYEVSATPKPGLVDRRNSGSHKDMDFFTFLDSSAALIPYFREFFCIGWDLAGEPASSLFKELRKTGQEAEAGMFSATGGVNTHKGLIFSSAVLCAALGNVYAGQPEGSGAADSRRVLDVCRSLGVCSLEDFARPSSGAAHPSETVTAGERFHALYGIGGARGEAAAGFPSVTSVGLPALKKWLSDGYSLNDAACLTLLSILAAVDDTNMIHRGGLETARACKEEAAALLSQITPDNFKEKLTALDASYIRRNLSPGGCADILAVSLMFCFLESGGLISPVCG